jgi:hypothetical protein
MGQLFDHAIVHSGGKPVGRMAATGQTNISRNVVYVRKYAIRSRMVATTAMQTFISVIKAR